MKFEPFNRHLMVQPEEEEREEVDIHRIVLPEDYNLPQNPYVVCEVLGRASSCDIDINAGDRILVERRMLHEVNAVGETIYIVLQNYVYGRIER